MGRGDDRRHVQRAFFDYLPLHISVLPARSSFPPNSSTTPTHCQAALPLSGNASLLAALHSRRQQYGTAVGERGGVRPGRALQGREEGGGRGGDGRRDDRADSLKRCASEPCLSPAAAPVQALQGCHSRRRRHARVRRQSQPVEVQRQGFRPPPWRQLPQTEAQVRRRPSRFGARPRCLLRLSFLRVVSAALRQLYAPCPAALPPAAADERPARPDYG